MNQDLLLIIGASGFIGSHLCKSLKHANRPFVRLVRASQTEIPKTTGLRVKWPEETRKLDLSPFSAVVHLGVGRIKQSMTSEEMERDYLQPLEGILEAIKITNPSCHLIFFSSQSAYEGAPGKYGKMKFESEERIKQSGTNYTLFRPGLVFGEGATGLLARIGRVIQFSPLVPLPGSKSALIQPVSVNQLTQAILSVLSEPQRHRNRLYPLAYPPLPFREFLRMFGKALGLRRIYLPVPGWLVEWTLTLLEWISREPSFTRSNWYGLVNLRKMDCEASWEALQIRISPLEEEFSRAMKA